MERPPPPPGMPEAPEPPRPVGSAHLRPDGTLGEMREVLPAWSC